MTQGAESRAKSLAAHLRKEIEDAGLTMREVDRKIGWGENKLSALVRGNIDLKLWQLLAVLEAIGKSEGDFFADYYGSASRQALDRETLAAARVLVRDAIRAGDDRLRQVAPSLAEKEHEPGKTGGGG